MQKVLRRTAYSQRRGKKLKQIQDETKERHARAAFKSEVRQINAQRQEAIYAERGRRRVNWELGPLSPWRSNFSHLVQETRFGAWDMQQAQVVEKPPRDRAKHLMFREGDRVAVVEGHESVKGRVGKIKNVDEKGETLTVTGINMADVAIQRTEEDIERGQREIQTTELPIPMRAVRLVYPLPDPTTQIPRDVIIDNLVVKKQRFDVYENKEVFERWLEPQHVRIPWPEQKEPKYKDEESDTLRKEAETVSFLPVLLRPPMPAGIIDELRNKFSKYRDRHDDEYIAQKQAEDAAEEVEKQRKAASVPRGAYNVARRRGVAGDKNREQVLSDDLAAQIGRHMTLKDEGSRA
ncbi:MAG: hypothetical protein Q9162_005548 [Coniocarpon cinnabarinum]